MLVPEEEPVIEIAVKKCYTEISEFSGVLPAGTGKEPV